MRIKVAVAAVLAFGSVQAASAADISAKPVFKAPPAVLATNWAGFYLTGGAGYGLWAADTTTSLTPGSPAAPMIVPQRQGGRGWLGRVGGGGTTINSPQSSSRECSLISTSQVSKAP